MTLSTALANINGSNDLALPNGAEAAANGYSPDRTHPLDIRLDSRPGSHDGYMAMVRSMVDREMRTLGSYIQSGHYRHPKLRSLVTRYYHLALWQITSPAGLMNHRRTELVRERANLHEVLKGLGLLEVPDDLRAMPQEDAEALYRTTLRYGSDTLEKFTRWSWMVPLTVRDAYDRLDEITALSKGLTSQIQIAQRKGHYFDCGPLIDYFRTPYKDRGDIDLMAIAPPFLHKLQAYIDVSISEVWRHQAQRITSQSADTDDEFSLNPNVESTPKKRSLLGRIRGR